MIPHKLQCVSQDNCVIYWLCDIMSLKLVDQDNLLWHFSKFNTMRLWNSGCVVFKKYKSGFAFCESNCRIIFSKIVEIICAWFSKCPHENQQGSATNKFQIKMCDLPIFYSTLYKISFLEVFHDASPQSDKFVDVPKFTMVNIWQEWRISSFS